jgi:hypothetical protein
MIVISFKFPASLWCRMTPPLKMRRCVAVIIVSLLEFETVGVEKMGDNIVTFRDVKPVPDIIHPYETYINSSTPIVIDHGMH